MSSNATVPAIEKPKKKGRIVESRYMSALKTKAPSGTSQTAKGITNKPNPTSSSIAGASRTQKELRKSFAPSSTASSISYSISLKRNSLHSSSTKSSSAKHQGLSAATTSSTSQRNTSLLSRSSLVTSSLAVAPKTQPIARKQSLKPTTRTTSSSTSTVTNQVTARPVRSRTSSVSSSISSRALLDKATDSKTTRLSSSHSRRPSVGRNSFGRNSVGGSQSIAPDSVSNVTLEEEAVLLYTRLQQWWFMNGKAKWEWEMQDENAEEQILQVFNLLIQKTNQVKELKSLIDQSKLLVQVENDVGTQIRELEPIVTRINSFERNYKVLSNALLDTISKMGVRNATIDDLESVAEELKKLKVDAGQVCNEKYEVLEKIDNLKNQYTSLHSIIRSQMDGVQECKALIRRLRDAEIEERSLLIEKLDNRQSENSAFGNEEKDAAWLDSVVESLVVR